jgi:osmoprotectant transport system permease protein
VRENAAPLMLAIVMASALAFFAFVTHAPNRLVSGEGLTMLQAAPRAAFGAGLLVAFLLGAALAPSSRRRAWASIVVSFLLLALMLAGAGAAASDLAARSPPDARTSLGAAFWIVLLCGGFIALDALQRLGARGAMQLAVAAIAVALVAAMLASGALDELSLLKEYAARRAQFAAELVRHCELVLGAVLPAMALGAPLGLLAARRAAWRGPLLGTLNVIETVPSIALFGLLIAPLSALASAAPSLGALGIHGIGATPAIIALILYSLLPVVRNTMAALASVDADAVEAARGMGMTPAQIFWRVELPLGMPVFLAGVRIVLVQAIGLAAVAALIGAGGLGTFVFQGIGQYAVDLVLLGALPIIALALSADFALALAIEAVQKAEAR